MGVGPHTRTNMTIEFVIAGAGRELWRSGPRQATDPAKPVRVDLQGIHRLRLGVAGDSRGEKAGYRSRDEGGWANPKLFRPTVPVAKPAH